ncbi:hypothetical protein [Thalassospira profundimaris]|uniref:hypothetical protein n=1 Tax=Thalassospira profundimaris TaxID=502049 RepID=UPI0011BF7B5E|nr:hypothetical protein [Thalassospira profundimaris]
MNGVIIQIDCRIILKRNRRFFGENSGEKSIKRAGIDERTLREKGYFFPVVPQFGGCFLCVKSGRGIIGL